MRIIGLIHKSSGPSYHRIIAPLLLMQDVDVYLTNSITEADIIKGCDVLVYNRILPDELYQQIKEWKPRYGFSICVDVDDYWHLDEHHILFREYVDKQFAANQIKHIEQADIVTVTHSSLYEAVRPHNSNVYILPNAIPKKGQFTIEREPHYLTRIFWQGSITHRRDIEILERPIDRLKDIAGKIKMVMAGYHHNEPEWHLMARSYTANFMHQYKLIPGTNVSMYYDAYREADICLVPLVNSPFNRMKSNLKVLEAANLGLPVICSHVHPYIGLPVLFAKQPDEWVTHIRRLVKSKNRQRDAGAELKDYCDQHYNFERINETRKQIFEYYAKKVEV